MLFPLQQVVRFLPFPYTLSLYPIHMLVAQKIEKFMRDFLRPGVGDFRRDNLVSWEVCCKRKKGRGIGASVIWYPRIRHWKLSDFAVFLYNLLVYGIESFKVILVCIQIGGTPTMQLKLLIIVLGILFCRVYLSFFLYYPYI